MSGMSGMHEGKQKQVNKKEIIKRRVGVRVRESETMRAMRSETKRGRDECERCERADER